VGIANNAESVRSVASAEIAAKADAGGAKANLARMRQFSRMIDPPLRPSPPHWIYPETRWLRNQVKNGRDGVGVGVAVAADAIRMQ